MWCWGANSHGQLGLNLISDQIEKANKVETEFSIGVKQIACGGGHSLLLDNEGKIFSCGWNSKKQLGYEKECHTFQRIWCLSGINFVNIACGWDFSCGVTDDKFLFVWGSNSHGQLGLPKDHFPDDVKPTRLHVNACAVSMGLRHTVIVNSKGEVWATGCGRHGQLGLGKDVLQCDRFTKVPLSSKISHIACGQNHTVAWCTDERCLYVWGDNKYTQLLLSSDKYNKIFKPEKIDIDVRQNIKKLISGWTHVLLWLEDGSLMTWGKNNYGQLGTESSLLGKIFHIKLPDNRIVTDVAIGSEHTLCLASDNTLWAWGWNEHANTGINTENCIYVPTQVPIEISINVKQIYAGGAHNFIISDESKQNLSSSLDNDGKMCNI